MTTVHRPRQPLNANARLIAVTDNSGRSSHVPITMRHLILFHALLLSGLTVLHAQPSSKPTGSPRSETIPHRIIIRLSGTPADPVAAGERILAPLGNRFGALRVQQWLMKELTGAIGGTQKPVTSPWGSLASILVVEYSADEEAALVAAKVARLAGIRYAEPAFRRHISLTPNDPSLARQWYLERIGAFSAWDTATADSTITIAILDTGVDLVHPDLAGAIWTNRGETGIDGDGTDRRVNRIDDDRNGFVDDWAGYDFSGKDTRSPDNDPSPGHWHGTHVAGIAAAVGNNSVGIAGVAYGAKIMALKVSDEKMDEPTLAGEYNAMLYAARMGARIINCSWGGFGRSQSEQDVIDAVTREGALVVAAAGNDGRRVTHFPGSYRNVLSVAALRSSDRRSAFTSFDASVGISAPGDEIYSTMPRHWNPEGYGTASGTSMAAPVVAGAAALVAAHWPFLEPEQIAAVLRATADNIDSLNPDVALLLGSGRVNVQSALQMGRSALFTAITDVTIADENSDGAVDAGERFELRVSVRNLLRPAADVRVRLVSDGAFPADIIAPLAQFGALATGQSSSSLPGTLVGVAAPNAPIDYSAGLRLELLEGDAVVHAERVDLIVRPNFATTRTPRVSATFSGNGRIGYNDFPLNEAGIGFRLGQSESLLAEGGLLVGTAATRLADVVRSGEIGLQSQGFQTETAYRVRFSDTAQAELGSARFDDEHLDPRQRVGLDVTLQTIAPAADDRNRMIVLLYRLANVSGQPLESLYTALYMDWDVGAGGIGNQAVLDAENRFGYISNVGTPGMPYVATMLVTDEQLNFDAMDNSSWPLSGGFFQVEKWDAMTSGVRRERSPVGDCSFVIGGGPVRIEAGEDTTIAFALLAGETLAELQSAAQQAREIVARYGLKPGAPVELPRSLALDIAAPNPFVDEATITVAIPGEGELSLDVFDATGRHVATLAEGVYPRGVHYFIFHPEAAASGVYFVRLIAAGETILRKAVRIGR